MKAAVRHAVANLERGMGSFVEQFPQDGSGQWIDHMAIPASLLSCWHAMVVAHEHLTHRGEKALIASQESDGRGVIHQ